MEEQANTYDPMIEVMLLIIGYAERYRERMRIKEEQNNKTKPDIELQSSV